MSKESQPTIHHHNLTSSFQCLQGRKVTGWQMLILAENTPTSMGLDLVNAAPSVVTKAVGRETETEAEVPRFEAEAKAAFTLIRVRVRVPVYTGSTK